MYRIVSFVNGYSLRGHLRTSMSDIRRNNFFFFGGGQRQFRLSSGIDILCFGFSCPLTLFVHAGQMIAPFRSSFYVFIIIIIGNITDIQS